MEIENFILKHYERTGVWLPDGPGLTASSVGPGVGGGPVLKCNDNETEGSVGNDP